MSRIICNLLSGSTSHWRIATPVAHTGDFDISFWSWAKTAATQIMLGDYSSNQNFVAIIATGTLQMRIGGTDIASAAGVIEPKKLYFCRWTRVGTAITGYVDGVSVATGTSANTLTLDAIGTYNSGSLPINGYIFDVDLETHTWALDEPTASTEDSTQTGNLVTYTNIPSGQRYTCTEVSGGEYWWEEDNSFRLELDVTQPQASTYILAGQSNMLSRATLVASTDDVYSTLNGRVLSWDKDTAARIGAQNPLPHGSEAPTSMGLWREMCLGLSAANLLMVPAAADGTGFSDNNWNSGDVEYTNAVTETNLAITDGTPSVLSGMIWLQGENDGIAGRTAAQYLADIQAMRTAMITDITSMDADTPWVCIEIGAVGAAYDEINDGLASFVASIPNGYLIPKTGLTLFDTFHYDAASIRSIGTQVAAALEPASVGGGVNKGMGFMSSFGNLGS